MFDCSHGIRPLVIWCRTLLDGLEIAPFYLFSVFHGEAGVLRSLPEGGDPPHLASPCGSCRFLRNAIDPIDPASLNLPIALACSLGLVDYSLRLASCDWYRGGVDQHHLDHLISFFASPPAKRAPLHTSAFEPTWIDSEDLRPSALSLLELTCRQARWEMDFLLALIGVVQRLSVSSHALRSFWPKPSSLRDCQCMAFALPVKLYSILPTLGSGMMNV